MACSASSTRSGSRFPADSRTTSPCPSQMAINRSTPRSSPTLASRSRSRSGRTRCTAWPSSASPPTGPTRKAARMRASIRSWRGCAAFLNGRTRSAKERIRKWFKSQRREENVAKGRDLLDKELHRMHRLNLADLDDDKLVEIATLHRFAAVDDFLAAIGYGDLSPHAVVMRMALSLDTPGGELRAIPLIPNVQPTPGVLVRAGKGIMTKIAPCCQPVPGDAIVGYTTRGKGVTVHRVDCINAVNAQDQARVVPVDWDSEATHLYPVAIKIEAWDRQGLLRDIATVVAENRVNMSSLEVHVYDDKTAVVSTTVEIDSLAQLSRLMEKLEGVKDVHTVAREAS